MNTDTMNPQDTDTTEADPQAGTTQSGTTQSGTGQTGPRPEPAFGYAPAPGALRRPFEGRVLTGVAEGLARYFGVDTTLVRIGFVVLTVIGGAGVPLYLAGLLLIPDEGSDQSIAASIIESFQNRNR
jgi:phage shock protein PspC (stress-responsive transcriptional regulator)